MLEESDWERLQGIINEAGCPKKLYKEDNTLLGEIRCNEMETEIWHGPSVKDLEDFNTEDSKTWIERLTKTKATVAMLTKKLLQLAS
jgi:hypothetical protein